MPGGHPHHRKNGHTHHVIGHAQKPTVLKKSKGGNQPQNLFVRGIFTGYRRGLRNQYPNTALLTLENVTSKEDVPFYLGKRVAYIYNGKRKDEKGSTYRVIWGKIVHAHGNNGVVRARFKRNLPASAMGSQVRVMLYPHRA
eukprot:snap_masked-scaffold_4-processed-gene-7.22-mRNA-1 protein AED:0.15 eAED:0.22 QI:0/-1/0/1/-1/1/1/0/140